MSEDQDATEIGERALWNDGDGRVIGVQRDTYTDAIDSGYRLRVAATDGEVTSDTLTVELVRYTDPVSSLERFAVRHDEPATAIAWDYSDFAAADARFDDHVRRLIDDGIEFAGEEGESS